MSDRFWKLKQTAAGTIFSNQSAADNKNDSFIGLMSGSIIGGAYEIVQFIGRGGMGEVYLARHQALGKKCALKVIPPDQVTEMGWQRFQLEARAVAKLDHINLVKVTDLGIHEGCLPFYAMDWVDGKDLAQLLAEHGRMPLHVTLEIFMQLCDGIDFAHRSGIVHRDLKPANIMVTQTRTGQRQAKVLDFGLAKLTNAGRASQSLTIVGDIFGSPMYMSPEQCLGEKLDNRSDIYSIGCTMFESLTGRPPFLGESPGALMFSQTEAEPPSLKSASGGQTFPDSMEIVMAKLLRKNPVERYQTMAELNSDLERVNRGEVVQPFYVSRSMKASIQTRPVEEVNERGFPLRLLVGAACISISITIVAIAATLHFSGSKNDKPLFKAVVLPPPEDLVAPARSDSIGKVEAFDSFSRVIKISNGIVTRNGISTRTFDFPKVVIGAISWGKELHKAQGTISAPAEEPVTLMISQVDGRYALVYPWVLKKIGNNDIARLDLNAADAIDPYEFDNTAAGLGALQAIKDWKALRTLMLCKCKMTNEVVQALNALSAHIDSFYVGDELYDGTDLLKIKWLKQLSTFTGNDLSNADTFLRALARSTSLKYLSLNHSDQSKDGLAALATCPNLETLTMMRTKLRDADLSAISQIRSLRGLKLAGCGYVSLEAMIKLSKLKGLQHLSIDCNPTHLNSLRKALPKCEVIIFSNTPERFSEH